MLYLVPTPIGNLKDITLRALEILKAADVIACEDTRRTGQLLKHFEIKPPLTLSFHDHSGAGQTRKIISLLKEGKSVALASDGGTPLISDPGFPLVRDAIKEGIRVEALPGASSVVTALIASGLPTERFSFLGFLPAKSTQRKKELERVSNLDHTLIFFESPYRLLASLKEMLEVLGDREIAVVRELTKKFEEIKRGDLSEVLRHFSAKKILGEIVLIVAGEGRKKVFA